jgi:hypothetical protein
MIDLHFANEFSLPETAECPALDGQTRNTSVRADGFSLKIS